MICESIAVIALLVLERRKKRGKKKKDPTRSLFLKDLVNRTSYEWLRYWDAMAYDRQNKYTRCMHGAYLRLCKETRGGGASGYFPSMWQVSELRDKSLSS